MSKLRRGKIRFWARQYLKGPIPLFVDNNLNRAIDREVDRILRARTKRRYRRKNRDNTKDL
jgi:hypothetical protein